VPSFLYGMPLQPGRVFLEETCLVTKPALPFAVLKRRLERRLKAMGIKVCCPLLCLPHSIQQAIDLVPTVLHCVIGCDFKWPSQLGVTIAKGAGSSNSELCSYKAGGAEPITLAPQSMLSSAEDTRGSQNKLYVCCSHCHLTTCGMALEHSSLPGAQCRIPNDPPCPMPNGLCPMAPQMLNGPPLPNAQWPPLPNA
jgi:hypothetical protein